MQHAAVVAVDIGNLSLGGGALSIVRPALELAEPGGVVAVISAHDQMGDELASWCRLQRHDYLGANPPIDGSATKHHLIQRGQFSVPPNQREFGVTLPKNSDGHIFTTDAVAAVPMPERADPATGFAPRGAQVEPGGPVYPFDLLERDRVVPPEIGKLYDQAVASQWNAATDIPWHTVKPLPDALERAVGQVMTFLAENELSAMYVPSQFIAHIHPAFAEVAMFLATQLQDEARHIDVFLKRARAAGGGVGVSSVTSSRSLLSLLELRDFTEAAFLLSVLGEGTFLDLLRYIERFAPDEATAELARRARADESRHVHFGLAHVRHALGRDPNLFGRLEAAVRRRAATLHGIDGVPDPVQDSLTILAAGGNHPAAVANGHKAFRELLQTMHDNRIRRLLNAGFTADQATILSDLHTPNFM